MLLASEARKYVVVNDIAPGTRSLDRLIATIEGMFP
jgi:hypothetical protein